MVWWQYLIVSVVSIVVGYCLSRLGAKSERAATEQRQLQDAVRSLLTEICANLNLIEKSPEPGLLPLLTRDMCNIHKSDVADLPREIQESLYQAYSSIDTVNAVVQNMYAFGSRQNYGPGAWDTRYANEAQKARCLMEKARDDLQKHLKKRT